MRQVTIERTFCYGHRLQNYAGKCNRLHGHNGRLQVTFESIRLDDKGFVVDFSLAKKLVNQYIDADFDHLMLLQQSDPVVQVLLDAGERLTLTTYIPTAENIAYHLLKAFELLDFGLGVSVVKVQLWETDGCSAVVEV